MPTSTSPGMVSACSGLELLPHIKVIIVVIEWMELGEVMEWLELGGIIEWMELEGIIE